MPDLIKYVIILYCASTRSSAQENFTTLSTTTADLSLPTLEPEVFCKFQPNGYDCAQNGIILPKFYYDLKMEDCKTAYFGSCAHNLNQFATRGRCQQECQDVAHKNLLKRVPAKVYCRFQPDFGSCQGYFPHYYYDISSRKCKGFSYSGCGGNRNRFTTLQGCVLTCSANIGY